MPITGVTRCLPKNFVLKFVGKIVFNQLNKCLLFILKVRRSAVQEEAGIDERKKSLTGSRNAVTLILLIYFLPSLQIQKNLKNCASKPLAC